MKRQIANCGHVNAGLRRCGQRLCRLEVGDYSRSGNLRYESRRAGDSAPYHHWKYDSHGTQKIY
jgi:hypothetical protein